MYVDREMHPLLPSPGARIIRAQFMNMYVKWHAPTWLSAVGLPGRRLKFLLARRTEQQQRKHLNSPRLRATGFRGKALSRTERTRQECSAGYRPPRFLIVCFAVCAFYSNRDKRLINYSIRIPGLMRKQ